MTTPSKKRSDPLWYRDAIFYELRVGALYDSDGDGIGDFRGLTEKLDYLADLGVTTLWVLPFYPSPLKDDGYDIADYANVRPDCGTLADFRNFLKEAHKRDLKVVTELVLNHTSDQHPWFKRARRAKPGSSERNFYVWSDTPDRYKDARIIFKDFETSNWTWDPVAKQYYWHRFYSHQPDLNFDHPPLQKEIFRVLDFWLGMGVDGLRLDAVPYLYEREGTNCENLPETHAFLKKLRQHIDRKFKNRMLLAEANQWSEEAALYFGQGDECHMAFHFPIMPRLFMSIQMEDRFPVVDILQQTPPIADNCQWAVFLRNHDELTLEMVTDEERDYMYRVYATDPQAKINLGIRRRLAPLLNNDRRKIELINGLLFSLPGTPVIYYGDEIGMGDNFFLGDRNGVRTPMQWSSDRNAGFSRANPQRLYLPVIIDPEYHYETLNVESQSVNPHSLLWWMKRLIALRKRHHAFGRGSIEFLTPSNRKVLAFLRRHGDEQILVVANLSRFVQYVEMDLSPYRGMVPVELFGQTDFPPITERPYLLTLGPRGFYWFLLQPQVDASSAATSERTPPMITAEGRWETLFRNRDKTEIEEVLPGYLKSRRWFGGKARLVKSVAVQDTIPFGEKAFPSFLVLAHVEYKEGTGETYLVPIARASGERAEQIRRNDPGSIVTLLQDTVKGETRDGLLYDAATDHDFAATLWETLRRKQGFGHAAGRTQAHATPFFKKLIKTAPATPEALEPKPLQTEQSNTSIVFGDRAILKLFRKLEEGINPDLEIGLFLTEKTSFVNNPQVAAYLDYRVGRREPMTLGILQEFVTNEGDAWNYTLDELDHYFERTAAFLGASGGGAKEIPVPPPNALAAAREEPPQTVRELLGGYWDAASRIGERTAELHRALASSEEDPHFAPEPFSTLYQRSVYQSLRNLSSQSMALLRESLPGLAKPVSEAAREVLGLEDKVLKTFQGLLSRKILATRIRCHGDFHLGQILFTGKDFIIFDFEGEPARPLSERRIKRSPLRDVTGLLRSFQYAAHTARLRVEARNPAAPSGEKADDLKSWARLWEIWTGGAFLKAYLENTAETGLLPKSEDDLKLLLNVFLLEKSIYELGYELNNRPDWVAIPLEGIRNILQEGESAP